jgi:hypothetical protein
MTHRRRRPGGAAAGEPHEEQATPAASRPPRGRLGAWLTASALGALALLPTSAEAQPFGPSGCCYYADNSNHTFFYSDLEARSVIQIDFARTQRLEPTDMTTQLQVNSYNADTDVLVYDWDQGANGGVAGSWRCDTLVSTDTTKCNQGHIILNNYYYGSYALSCQEIGHSVGLDHSTSTGSCMYQDSSQAANDYDDHDKGHINGRY